jgi:NADH-quinone oxidoreductase subunit E
MKEPTRSRKHGMHAPVEAAVAVKPSRRRAPVPVVVPPSPITPEVIDGVCAQHRGRPGELLGILEELQTLHPHKFLPPETLEYVAEKVGVPVSQVFSVATFYAFFNLQPQGEHTLVVCRGTACHTRGSKARFEALKRLLKLKEEEGVEKIFLTTADKKFTVKTVACFGQCALAPVVEVDGRMKSHVTEVCLKELVNSLTKRGRKK